MAQCKYNGASPNTSRDEDGALKDRFCRFMESLAQRLKRDGLRLFLLVLANGFYLYVGGMIFFLLERKERPSIDRRRQVTTLINAITSVRMESN